MSAGSRFSSPSRLDPGTLASFHGSHASGSELTLPGPSDVPGHDNAADVPSDAALFLDPAVLALPIVAPCASLDAADGRLGTLVDELKAITSSVIQGDTQYPEAMAVAQATALNVMFSKLSSLALGSLDHPSFESFMRLALRAQAQSVRTLETLATVQNPPVFAQQLNVAHRQVVANGSLFDRDQTGGTRAAAASVPPMPPDVAPDEAHPAQPGPSTAFPASAEI